MAKKILIIDDDPVIVKYLVGIFEDDGYDTCSAINSSDGYDKLIDEKPGLITLDPEIPGEWGRKFYRNMSNNKIARDTPIVVISCMSGKHTIKKAVTYVAKPFDPDKVITIVRKAIGVP